MNYTRLVGRHSLKTGYEFQHIDTEVQDVNPLYGRDTYSGQFTRPAGVAANNIYNLADFIAGPAIAVRPQQRARCRTSARICTSSTCRTTPRERAADAEPRPALRVRDANLGGATTS